MPGDTKPRLTLAMIKSQWAHTPFAKPEVSVQPKGNRTLVTLPIYVQVRWPTTGYQPDEVRTVTLIGHQVRIKPTHKSNRVTFGDGSVFGPSASMGGVYPTGDIRHAYEQGGKFSVQASATYGGQYSVDGGEWLDIPGATTLTGPAQSVEVVTSKNRLVNN